MGRDVSLAELEGRHAALFIGVGMAGIAARRVTPYSSATAAASSGWAGRIIQSVSSAGSLPAFG